MGITLSPQMVQRFPGWIAPIASGGMASPQSMAQTVFQIQPMPAPGTLEYTVEIDGQQLRYRNTPAQWANMVHPSAQGTPDHQQPGRRRQYDQGSGLPWHAAAGDGGRRAVHAFAHGGGSIAMRRGMQTARLGYFGKLPARADFIKAADNLALASLLDEWLAEVMNVVSADPRWKLNYDAMPPLDFAFVGTRSRRAIAGHLAASSDLSQRRYPFLGMSAIDVDDPAGFVSRSPLILAPLWEELRHLTADVMDCAEPDAPLQALAAGRVDIDTQDEVRAQHFTDFLDRHTIAALEAMLASASVRRTILAIGLLLQPVRRSGAERLDKSLVLPLPQSSRQRYLVAAFWLGLIVPFLQQGDFELSLFLADLRGMPSLVVGFGGAAPETLAAIIDPASAAEHQISFDYAGWVDELIA
ncbi:conserved hypothetical protein, partial [Ricinus communis]